MSISAEEQLLLELTNRARLDPAGEAARLAQSGGPVTKGTLSEGTTTSSGSGPLEPLANNSVLNSAAEGHADWIIETDRFSHTGAGGSNAGQRISDAGYNFSDGGAWSENLAFIGSSAALNLGNAVHTMHANLFNSDGHRANMLADGVREIGLSIGTGDFLGMNAAVATQNFARSGSERFVTGVIYEDLDDDDFYSIGEGVEGVTIASRQEMTRSADAGGYTLSLGSGGDKPVVSISAGDTTYTVRILDRTGNVKIDLVDGDTLMTSASLKLMGNSQNAVALGIGDITLKGRKGANDLTGNAGDNLLVGGRGKDRLDGGAGDDRLKGGGGADTFVFRVGGDSDRILDFKGADTLMLDEGLWSGTLDAAAVIDRFARIEGRDTVLDFGNGDVVTLHRMTDLDLLEDNLLIF